jgi:tetratricopeptide (TPR) repeat protein
MIEIGRSLDSEGPAFENCDPASPVRDNRDLMMRFESLGGTGHGCEFGLAQRHFGAEPLGLLRWADLGYESLIMALECRFEGVGLAENTIVFNPEHSDEWWTKDTRYWMAMRSFVKTADVNLERMIVQICRRLQFLQRKLIEDLQTGEKIFTYKNMFRNLTDVELARLHAAVRSFGNSTLFYVRYADDNHPAGMVEANEPGLLVGYIDHFAFSPEDKLLEPANDAWLALCDRAYQMHNGLPSEATTIVGASVNHHRVKPAGARRIVLVGNCQMQAMEGLYRRFVSGRTGDVLEYVASYQDLTPEGQSAIEKADLVVEQLLDLKQHADTAAVTTGAPRLYIPMVTGAFLWPFAGQRHPKNIDYPFLAGGPYSGEMADSYLNRLIVAGVDPEEAVESYANLDVNSRVKLDRLYELVVDRQRSRDEAAGYRIADVIERHFRTEQIFLSPYHPNVRVAVELASQFFEQLGAELEEIERMRHCTQVTPFPKIELPLHPSVCRHFGLDFVAPTRRYRFMNEGLFTFREFALRYMRYEWNDALEEGLSLVHTRNYAAARGRLELGLQRSPNSAAGQNAMGHVLTAAGMRDEAIAAVRRAIEIEPDAGSFRAHLGNLLRETGQFVEAEVQFRAAIAGDPVDPHYYVLLAHLLRRSGRVTEGADLMVQAIELDPYSHKLRIEHADFAEARGELDVAVAALRHAIALAPEHAPAHHRLAYFLRRQGRVEQAIDAARRAVTLEPNVARYRVALSELLLGQGKMEQALTEADAACGNEPDSVHAHGHLGHILWQTGDHANAETAFRHAAKLDPANAHVRHQLSAFLHQQQRFDEAIEAAKQAAELQPDNPHRFAHLANFLAQRNDLPGAQSAQRQAVDLQPETLTFRVVLSNLLARQGRLDAALIEAQIAVGHHPGSAYALGQLAHVTQMGGDLDQAEILYRKAIALEPHNEHLRRQLAFVASRRAPGHAA